MGLPSIKRLLRLNGDKEIKDIPLPPPRDDEGAGAGDILLPTASAEAKKGGGLSRDALQLEGDQKKAAGGMDDLLGAGGKPKSGSAAGGGLDDLLGGSDKPKPGTQGGGSLEALLGGSDKGGRAGDDAGGGSDLLDVFEKEEQIDPQLAAMASKVPDVSPQELLTSAREVMSYFGSGR
ncbi:MAG: hypothetical protein HY681_06700 [Chloroflexi bacterium]|nr:hypothetical protein [Chloroflexota bacterium]